MHDSSFIVFSRSALSDFLKPTCTKKNGCKSYSMCVFFHRFSVHAFLWYCFSKWVVIFVSMCFHKDERKEVCYVCVRILVYIFSKGSVWVDLLWKYGGVKVKDSLLVINVSADGGNRSNQSVKFISWRVDLFGKIFVLLKLPGLKATVNEQEIDEFWWWFFCHIHTFDSATFINDSAYV